MVAKGRLTTDDGLKAAKEANEPQQPTSGECFRNNENDRKRLKKTVATKMAGKSYLG